MSSLAVDIKIAYFQIFKRSQNTTPFTLAKILGPKRFGPPFLAVYLAFVREANLYDQSPKHLPPASSPRLQTLAHDEQRGQDDDARKA